MVPLGQALMALGAGMGSLAMDRVGEPKGFKGTLWPLNALRC